MNSSLIAACLTCATLTAPAALAADQEWVVTGATADIGIFAPENLVDEQGLYGQAGRALRVGPITAEFDAARGGRFTRDEELQSDGSLWVIYGMRVNYRLRYDVYDADSGERIASEDYAFVWGTGGINPETQTAQFHGYRGGFSTDEPDLGLFGSFGRDYGDGFGGPIRFDAPYPDISTITYDESLMSGTDYNYLSMRIGNGTSLISFNTTLSVSPVPEAETYAMLGVGLISVLVARRRRRH